MSKQGHPFWDGLKQEVTLHGGFFNAHLHLDRAFTLNGQFFEPSLRSLATSSHISLQRKHSLIGAIHEGPAYDETSLRKRFCDAVNVLIAAGTTRADSMIDVTLDRVGTDALALLKRESENFSDRIALRLAVYSPFGFTDGEPGRWSLFEDASKQADFIGALPEADDREDYADHIGFEEHCVRMLDLARRRGKMLHVHTDQRNTPNEDGTERLLRMVKKHGVVPDVDGEAQIWAVHMISPSTYDEARWERFVEDMLSCRVGVICCPSAAIGMRQVRPIQTPTYNSIPRLLELAAAGVPVRIASDNVGDICSPSTTADLADEVLVLSAALRFYDVPVLAKFAAGVALEDTDRNRIRDHLDRNNREIEKFVSRWK